MATRILLVRHGAPVGAETGRFIGHLDVPLSLHGEAQADALSRRLAREPLAAVYTSDLARTRRTAEILAAPHGLTPVSVSALREFAMGEWEGLTAVEIKARDAAAFAAWMASVGDFQFPGGENLSEVAARSWIAFETIVAGHPGRTVAVVAHGGTNRAILCRALRVPLERFLSLGQDYAATSVLETMPHGFRLRRLNEPPPLL
jgi:broad specificity phosphatase PhoE